jgi:hypothetical protein
LSVFFDMVTSPSRGSDAGGRSWAFILIPGATWLSSSRLPDPLRCDRPKRRTVALRVLDASVCRTWPGPAPRLLYVTDEGTHQSRYCRRVLNGISDSHRPGRRLRWQRVIDDYHTSEHLTKLSEALFPEAREGASWARKMDRWLGDTRAPRSRHGSGGPRVRLAHQQLRAKHVHIVATGPACAGAPSSRLP